MDPASPRGAGRVVLHAAPGPSNSNGAAAAASSWSPQARASASQRPASMLSTAPRGAELPPLTVARPVVTRDADEYDTHAESEVVQRRAGAASSPRRLTPHGAHGYTFESKDDAEELDDARSGSSGGVATPRASAGAASASFIPAVAPTAAVAAAPHSTADDELPPAAAAHDAEKSDEEEEEEDSDDESDKEDGPTAAEVYARPLLYFKRAPLDRRRGGAPPVVEQGPAQLLLPDNSMCLGFPPLKEKPGGAGGGGGGGAGGGAVRGDGLDDLDNVVVFTPPNEEQASKTKLFACLLLFLIPADLILICTIFFLGGAVVSEEVAEAGATDLVTFLCALVALALGVVGMRLRDTRILTLFIVVYYIDSVINLVRISSILQLAQFFMQISVCHVTSLFKNSLVPQWWIADP